MEKLPQIYLTCYNLFIAHDLWQSHYQILTTVILKKVTEFNVNLDMMKEHV